MTPATAATHVEAAARPARLVEGKPPIPPRERDASVNFASQSCANNRGRGVWGAQPPRGAAPLPGDAPAARRGKNCSTVSYDATGRQRTQQLNHAIEPESGATRQGEGRVVNDMWVTPSTRSSLNRYLQITIRLPK
jgi:hypothetical protein